MIRVLISIIQSIQKNNSIGSSSSKFSKILANSLTKLDINYLPIIDETGLRRSHTQGSNNYMWLKIDNDNLSNHFSNLEIVDNDSDEFLEHSAISLNHIIDENTPHNDENIKQQTVFKNINTCGSSDSFHLFNNLAMEINDFMNSINFGDDFFYKVYLPVEPNYVKYIEMINGNLMSEHLSNYYEEIEANRSILISNVPILIKFMKRAPYYLTRLKITSLKVARVGISYLLYSSGLILVNYPGKFTKSHKKHDILKPFDSFLSEREGRAPPKIDLKLFILFCSEF